MAQYLISVPNTAETLSREFGPYSDAEEMQVAMGRTGDFNDKLGSKLLQAGGLHHPSEAYQVTPDGTVTEGGYGQGEVMGGFWLIEAADDEEARQIALDASAACGGRIEVRKLHGAD